MRYSICKTSTIMKSHKDVKEIITMRVAILIALLNILFFIINILCMNLITKEVYKNLKRLVDFKCLSKKYAEYDIKASKKLDEISLYVLFFIPILNIITLFILLFNRNNIVKEIQEAAYNNFINWLKTENE